MAVRRSCIACGPCRGSVRSRICKAWVKASGGIVLEGMVTLLERSVSRGEMAITANAPGWRSRGRCPWLGARRAGVAYVYLTAPTPGSSDRPGGYEIGVYQAV